MCLAAVYAVLGLGKRGNFPIGGMNNFGDVADLFPLHTGASECVRLLALFGSADIFALTVLAIATAVAGVEASEYAALAQLVERCFRKA